MSGRKPVTQCTRSEWRELTDQLRACCPPPEGYTWRFMWCKQMSTPEETGECARKEPKDGKRGQYLIKIVQGLSYGETLDTLMHEMAHAYDATWGPHHSWGGQHSDTFWIWHGRIFRRWHNE